MAEMDGRKAVWLGLVAMTALPMAASAQAAGTDTRHPFGEGHFLPRPRGDVMVVQGEGSDVRAGVRAYVAPFRDARYVPVRPGERLRAPFYAQRYGVADPSLRPVADANRRWVRYFGDLLLVDLRSGRIIRVVSKHFV